MRIDAARDRIIQATADLVAQGGWTAATVAAVARRAGVATGTVYTHVSGKDELFAEVFRRAAGHELEHVAAAADGSAAPLERLEAALRGFAERALRGRRLAHALLAEPAGPAVEVERLTYRRAYHQLFRELLEAAIVAGELPDHDTTVVAAVLTGAMGEVLIGPVATVADVTGRPEQTRHVEALVAACLRALPATPETTPLPVGPRRI